jgi:hypothetical protein
VVATDVEIARSTEGWCIADPRDVTTVLNQLFTTADLAAERRRTLLAEAEDYRLAREAAEATTTEPEGKGPRLFRLLRPAPRFV